MSIKISKAKESDILSITKLNQSLDKKASTYHPRKFILSQIQQKGVYLAKTDGKLLGYLLSQCIWGNTYFLALLKVLPTHQRQGIGTALLEEFERELKKNAIKVYISSSEVANKLGQNFHIKNGFKEVGRATLIHGEEIFYKKTL